MTFDAITRPPGTRPERPSIATAPARSAPGQLRRSDQLCVKFALEMAQTRFVNSFDRSASNRHPPCRNWMADQLSPTCSATRTDPPRA